MGIFIHLAVSRAISQEEWEPAYEESLRLAKAFGLCDSTWKKKYDRDLYCLIPTEEIMVRGKKAWCAVGDLNTWHTGEDYCLYRDFSWEEPRQEGVCYDPLMSILPAYMNIDWEDPRTKGSFSLWDGKSQGEPYHIALLAIALMLETRLSGKVVPYGDITRGQCNEALKMLEKFVEIPVETSVRCDLHRLFARVIRLPLQANEQVAAFRYLYLGAQDQTYHAFVKSHFTKKAIQLYWERNFEKTMPGTIGFSQSVKEYLSMEKTAEGLAALCRYVDLTEPKDGKMRYSQFLESIMQTYIWKKEKDLRNPLEIDQEGGTYSIYTLMAQFAFAGARNYAVDTYLPLNQVRQILRDFCGDSFDSDAWIDEFLEQEKQDSKQQLKTTLANNLDAICSDMEQQQEDFDITETDQLIHYKPGDKISPSLEEALIKSYPAYHAACEEDSFTELINGSWTDRCAFLIEQNQYLRMPETEWEQIFARIKKTPDSYFQYYPMVRMKVSDQTRWMVEAFAVNDALYTYIEQKCICS